MHRARPERYVPAVASVAIIAGLALTGGAAWLASPAASAIAGAAIALFGLPHGALDIEVLTRARAHGRHRFADVLTLYLGCAAAMAALWWLAPVVALVLFIAVAVLHFGEDWAAAGAPFLQHGLALALIAVPALLHRPEVAAIFIALTGIPAAGFVATALLVVAPVAVAVALVAVAAMIAAGGMYSAAAASISLVALLLLPPAPGFAVYFCMFHSPQHLRAACHGLGWRSARQWLPVVVPVTAAALGIATLLYLVVPASGVPARVVAAVFMTLSVVTLPHLAVPRLLAFSRPRRQLPAWSISTGH